MKDRHALVTGASGGLGEHFARLLARFGAAVTVAARRVDRLASLVKELRQLGASHAHAVLLDVRDKASVEEALAACSTDGAPSLDLLINNAGTAASDPAILTSAETFDRIIGTNLRGSWLLSVAAARAWRVAARPGVIVNIASVLGLRVSNGVAPYAVRARMGAL